ncbi:MAG: HNH endonuclease [Isosphaera sp.]|nr:HNH endonuclease [Isosphaera sp.]
MRQSKYTAELLAPLAADARSVAELLTRLGLRPNGGNYRYVAARLRLLGIDTAHFGGQGWARGRTQDSDPGVARNVGLRRRPDENVFVENSPETCGARLARRLVRLGREYRCGVCGIDEWRGKPLSLHLDHINGVSNDNRFENLRFLCPNCHSQTETYCKRMECRTAR